MESDKCTVSKNKFKKINMKKNNYFYVTEINPTIPTWLVWIQGSAFLVLYAVWILPGTVGMRNTALVVGALASIYPIYRYRSALVQKSAFSIWCILCLFIWAAIHFLFFSEEYESQLLELNRIWKYAALSLIFGFGFGLSLSNNNKNYNLTQTYKTHESLNLDFIYLCLSLPTLICLIKILFTYIELQYEISVPPYLKNYNFSQDNYIPKSDYVAFCLPTLAIALGYFKYQIEKGVKLTSQYYLRHVILACSFFSVLFIFYFQNIKNGMAHALILIIIFIGVLVFTLNRKKFLFKLLIIIFGCIFIAVIFINHVQKNHSWKSFVADTRIAWQTHQYDHWKFAGEKGYPVNQMGTIVSITNYERAAWMKIGAELSLKNPLGYGLIENSFKRMVKSEWPEANNNLSHSHSGWLDFTLAFGFPGLFCLFGALGWTLWRSVDTENPWNSLVFWGLLANLLLWTTTEVSTTVNFCALIIWISLSAGLVLELKKDS